MLHSTLHDHHHGFDDDDPLGSSCFLSAVFSMGMGYSEKFQVVCRMTYPSADVEPIVAHLSHSNLDLDEFSLLPDD